MEMAEGDPSRGDTSYSADIRALGEQVDEKYRADLEPMSATLTPERKSARDRPGVKHKMRGRGRESGRSTEVLEAGRCRVTLVEMTNASERARAAAQ